MRQLIVIIFSLICFSGFSQSRPVATIPSPRGDSAFAEYGYIQSLVLGIDAVGDTMIRPRLPASSRTWIHGGVVEVWKWDGTKWVLTGTSGGGGGGTVTNVSATDTYALSWVVTNPTTTPNLTGTLDTALLLTQNHFYNSIDSLILTFNSSYVKYTDTASMLSHYVRRVLAGSNVTVDNTNPQYPIVSSTAGGSGTVTSVALAAPSIYTVSGSPVTTSGTLTFTPNNAQGDLIYGSATNTLAYLNKSTTANSFLKNSGTSNNPAWATIAASDIGSGAALTKVDDTNITLTLGGSPSTALLAATSLTLGWTGVLGVSRGGTSFGSYTTGDMLYASGSGTLSKLSIGSAGQHLVVVGGVPVWRDTAAAGGSGVTTWSAGTTGFTPSSATSGAVTLAGTLNAVNGGTGQSSYTVGDILWASATTALSKLGHGTAGQRLGWNGSALAWIDTAATTGLYWSLANGGTLTGTNTITAGSNPFIFSTGVSTGTGATAGHQVVANSLTTGNGIDASTSSITTGNLFKLTSTSTAANAFSLLNINSSGANANSTRTATGQTISVTNTGTTSTNVGLNVTASGGTNNYAILATGRVGIGETAPVQQLSIKDAGGLNNGLLLESTNNANWTYFNMKNGTGDLLQMYQMGSTYTPTTSPAVQQRGSLIYASGSGGLSLSSNNNNIKFFPGLTTNDAEIARFNNSGLFVGTTSGSAKIQASRTSGNVGTGIRMTNTGNGASDYAVYECVNDASVLTQLYLTSSAYTGGTATIRASGAGFYNGGAGGMSFVNGHASSILTYANNDPTTPTERFRIDAAGGVEIGGAANAHASSILDISTTVKGILIPRMSETQRNNITSPATGLTVYNTSTNTYDIYDGTRWEYTPNGLTGSATLDFGSTAAQTSTDLTVTITGAADQDPVYIGVPNGSTSANSLYTAWVSAANTVTVRFLNIQAAGAIDPASGSFKIFVKKN